MPPSDKQSTSQTPTAERKGASSKPCAAEESADLQKLLEAWTRKRFGLRGLVVLGGIFFALGIWWEWDHIIKLPWIKDLVTLMTEKALPKAVPGKFTSLSLTCRGTTVSDQANWSSFDHRKRSSNERPKDHGIKFLNDATPLLSS
jgi:hypothetical protein